MPNWIFIALWAAVGAVIARPVARLVERLGQASLTEPRDRVVLPAWTLAVFAALGARCGLNPPSVAFSILAAFVIPLVAIDLRETRLPTRPMVVTAVPVLVILGFAALVNHQFAQFGRSLITSAACFLLLASAYLIVPAFIGGGDVRLATLLVIALGWIGWVATFRGLILGFVFGAMAGLVQITRKRIRRDDCLPLGPALAAGALLSLLIE